MTTLLHRHFNKTQCEDFQGLPKPNWGLSRIYGNPKSKKLALTLYRSSGPN